MSSLPIAKTAIAPASLIAANSDFGLPRVQSEVKSIKPIGEDEFQDLQLNRKEKTRYLSRSRFSAFKHILLW